jgi:hypothetical protein
MMVSEHLLNTTTGCCPAMMLSTGPLSACITALLTYCICTSVKKLAEAMK